MKRSRVTRHLAVAFWPLAGLLSLQSEEPKTTPLPVAPPAAIHCEVAKPGPRLTILLSQSGKMYIGGTEFDLEQLTAIAATVSQFDPKARVLLRADKTVATDHVKRVIKACGAGGMNTFIFGSYTQDDLELLLEKEPAE